MADYKGTPGNDVYGGTEGYDYIVGIGGNDVLAGRGGDDLIFGRGGDDLLLGNTGEDLLVGGGGNDTLYGGRGDDTLQGKSGDDVLSGDFGADVLFGGNGADTFVFEVRTTTPGSGVDTILDLRRGDILSLRGFDGHDLTQVGDDVLLTADVGGETREIAYIEDRTVKQVDKIAVDFGDLLL